MSRFEHLLKSRPTQLDNLKADLKPTAEDAKRQSLEVLNRGFKVVEEYYKTVIQKKRPDLVAVGSVTNENDLFIPVEDEGQNTHSIDRFTVSLYRRDDLKKANLPQPANPIPIALQLPSWNEYVHGHFNGAVIKPWNQSVHQGGSALRPEFEVKVRGEADRTEFQSKVGQSAHLATLTDQDGSPISKVTYLPDRTKPDLAEDTLEKIIEVLHPLFTGEEDIPVPGSKLLQTPVTQIVHTRQLKKVA